MTTQIEASNYYDCYNKLNGRLLGTLYLDGSVRSEDILGFGTIISQLERKKIKENILTITLHATSVLRGLDSRKRLGTTFRKLKSGKVVNTLAPKRRKRTKITDSLKLKIWDEHDRGFEVKKIMERNKVSRRTVQKILGEKT